MSQKEKSDYFNIAIRPGSTPYFPGMLSNEAMTSQKMFELVGARFEKAQIVVNFADYSNGFWSEADLLRARKTLFEKQQKHNQIQEYTDSIMGRYEKIMSILENYYTLNDSAKTKQTTIAVYGEICDHYRTLCCFAYVANILNVVRDVRADLAKYVTAEEKLDEYVLELTRNPGANFIYDHDLELIEILDSIDKTTENNLAEHSKKWHSLFMGSIGKTKPYDGINKRISMFREMTSAERTKKKEEYLETLNKVRLSQDRLENNLGLSDETKASVSIVRDIILLKETRKFCMTRIISYFDKFAEDLGGLYNLSASLSRNIMPEEYTNGYLMTGQKITESSAEAIVNSSFYIFENGIGKRYLGEQVPQMIQKYDITFTGDVKVVPKGGSQQFKKKKTYKGFVACLGKYKGPVRLVEKLDDLNDFHEGDVLVTSITTPEYAVIFDKIKAMITFDGASLTSHPATLAREYKIPAILGVEDLYSVLKNGDIVEVDANNNRIRIF
ncbi:MAG: PEP-utilizing enzyme [bacterium]